MTKKELEQQVAALQAQLAASTPEAVETLTGYQVRVSYSKLFAKRESAEAFIKTLDKGTGITVYTGEWSVRDNGTIQNHGRYSRTTNRIV